METINTYKDLAKAIVCDANRIEVTGDITKGTVKIVSTGAVSWAIAFGAISVAYAAIALIPTTGGSSTAASFAFAPVAVASIGVSATAAAISIATGAGSVLAIKKLRGYRIESESAGKAVLVKK